MTSPPERPWPADLAWLDAVKFDAQGLVTAVAQEASTGVVLMVAWMNRQSLALSLAEGRAVYWSRSRQALWRKGETSGHVQWLKGIALDCDGDTILLKVEQVGGLACHTGRPSCFFRRLGESTWEETEAASAAGGLKHD